MSSLHATILVVKRVLRLRLPSLAPVAPEEVQHLQYSHLLYYVNLCTSMYPQFLSQARHITLSIGI